MKAIDLYSGIGGWALGLELNSIKVISSYEWWDQAVETANNNLGKTEKTLKNGVPFSVPKNIPQKVLKKGAPGSQKVWFYIGGV